MKRKDILQRLEERLARGEISEKTYLDIKARYDAEPEEPEAASPGPDLTVKIQDPADNPTFAAVAARAFAHTPAAQTTQRIATANTATIRRYLRAVTVTTGGFTLVTFAAAVVRNQIADQVF